NYKAAYEITAHLISQGCKDIVHITGNLLRNVYSERLAGFKQAHADHDIPFREENVFITRMTPEESIEVAQKILNRNPLPDAVFASNDLCAAHTMLELKRHGIKIPDDIALAGFNNDPVSKLVEPGLTTIYYKGFEMGELAIQMMVNQLNQLQNMKMIQSIVLGHELIIRQSSLRRK
ncbi:MAG: substrate-binding domain-containing protein, partial [Bacteroidota bacterium]|nr:substrate-binding domain-containing protein [Bacteroidota bacterium]